MSFFVSEAWAQAAPAGPLGMEGFASFIPLILIFVVFWFLLIRPQQKRQKEHKGMVDSLSKGDEVVSTGGLLGRVVALDDQFVTLEIASGVQVHLQRMAVATLMPKGTIKGL